MMGEMEEKGLGTQFWVSLCPVQFQLCITYPYKVLYCAETTCCCLPEPTEQGKYVRVIYFQIYLNFGKGDENTNKSPSSSELFWIGNFLIIIQFQFGQMPQDGDRNRLIASDFPQDGNPWFMA